MSVRKLTYTAFLLASAAYAAMAAAALAPGAAGALTASVLLSLAALSAFVLLAARLEKEPDKALGPSLPAHLADSIPDIIIELDLHGRTVYANEAFTRATGLAAGEAAEALGAAPAPLSEGPLAPVTEGSALTGLELAVRLRDGRPNIFEFTAAPIKAGGAVAGCLLMGRDVDEKKRMAEELGRARVEALESSEKLKRTIIDLEEFSLLAIRRELKMRELRERFIDLKERHAAEGEFPS